MAKSHTATNFLLLLAGAKLLALGLALSLSLLTHFLLTSSSSSGEMLNLSLPGLTGQFRVQQKKSFSLIMQQSLYVLGIPIGRSHKKFQLPKSKIDPLPAPPKGYVVKTVLAI